MLTAAQRTIDRCNELALDTEEPGMVTRRFLTPPMKNAHLRITQWMQQAGMQVRVDDAGNLFGRLGGAELPTLLIGSHLDTVPNGGKYDGIVGVMVGIAVAETFKDITLPFAIEVIGFSEEEGVRYAQPYLGSRAITGTFDPSWLDRVDTDGVSMRLAISNFGLNPDRITAAEWSGSQVLGFIEAHIEQGPVLEQVGLPVGIVSSIIGQCRAVVQFIGKAGHAGTVPMANRQDAIVGAAQWISFVRQFGSSIDGLRATVGKVRLTPNASNVIPGFVELSLDVRHESDSIRTDVVSRLIEQGQEIALAENLDFVVLHQSDSTTVTASNRLQSLLSQAIASQGISPFTLFSGAGHDAVVMGQRFPMGMLFVRHPNGISHHPEEHVDVDDVAIAIDVLNDFIKRLAAEELTT